MKIFFVFLLLFKYLYSIGESNYRTISEEGIKFIMEREGYVKNVYKDQGNINTIGYGFTSACESLIGRKIEDIKDLNEDDAKSILKYLISHKYEHLVKKYDIIYRFNQNQYDALISFAYNYGGIDKLTNYGKKTIEEISESIIDNTFMTVNGIKNTGLENRRKLEKSLFDKPISTNSNQMRINLYEECSSSFIFASILREKDNSSKIGEYCSNQDIGIIFYDNQNGNIMRSLCDKYYHNSYNYELLICLPYYPILEGVYIIKLIKKGIFSNGDSVLPFDLTNNMYNKTTIYNEASGQYEEIIEDRRIKVYNVSNPLPFYCEHNYNSGLFGNYFFYRGYISLYDKKENIKSSYQVKVKLSFCYNDHSCEEENEYIVQCNIITLRTEKYNEKSGEHLLKCEGLINTNVYFIPNFGNHIEIRYKIADSSIQKIEIPFHLYSNFKVNPPRDILQVQSIEYKGSSDDGRNVFRIYGESKNKKSIRNIGTEKELKDFSIYFYGGFYNQRIPSNCHLFDNSGNFIIECYFSYFNEINSIFSFVDMENTYINENADDYDILLPFELYYSCTISGKNISSEDDESESGKDNESESGKDNKSENKSSFHNISLLTIILLIILVI